MKRLIIATCLVLMAFSGAVLGQQSSALAAGGNSLAAADCQQLGYLTIIGTNGTTDTTATPFTNTGDCVSYAAQGGTLVSQSAAAPCLNGGFANLTSVTGSPAAFTSEAACVLFVGQGGTPVPVATFTALGCIYDGTFTFTGSGLQPNSPIYLYSINGNVVPPYPSGTVDQNGTPLFTHPALFAKEGIFYGDTLVFSAVSATGTPLYAPVVGC